MKKQEKSGERSCGGFSHVGADCMWKQEPGGGYSGRRNGDDCGGSRERCLPGMRERRRS